MLAYAEAMPRAARALGLSTGPPLVIRDADVRRVGRDIVLVRVDLDDRPQPVASSPE